MIKQYPYRLWIQTQPDSEFVNGAFTETETVWENVSVCRDEANQRGQVIQLTDSSTLKYDVLIQLPTSCPTIAEGTPIQVRDGDTVRVNATAKRFSRDQLHCRLWV